MAFEHKDMSGSMFEQNNKTKETQPDLKGKVKIKGKLWDIAAWRSDRNPEMFSIKISEPRAQQGGGGEYQGEPQTDYQQRTQQAVRDSNPQPPARQMGRPQGGDASMRQQHQNPPSPDSLPF